MSPEQAAELIAAGPEVGFHTREHHSLPQLEDGELNAALTKGRADLEALTGAAPRTFAYPHGDHDERVVEATRAGGYELGLTCRRTAVTPESDPLALGRIEMVPGSKLGYAAQVIRGVFAD